MNYFYDIFEDKTLGMCIRETSDQGHIYVWDLIYLFDESDILNQLIINNNFFLLICTFQIYFFRFCIFLQTIPFRLEKI